MVHLLQVWRLGPRKPPLPSFHCIFSTLYNFAVPYWVKTEKKGPQNASMHLILCFCALPIASLGMCG